MMYFNTPTGSRLKITEQTRPPGLTLPLTEANRGAIQAFVNQRNAAFPYPTAEAAIAAMVAWIDDLHSKVTGPVPRDVKFGWKAKADWARAWDATTNPDVPTIYADEMAAAGTAKYPDTATFVARVIFKADIYEGVIADTEGLRTRTQDAIEEEATKPNPDPHQYEVILQAAMAEAATMAAARGITLPT